MPRLRTSHTKLCRAFLLPAHTPKTRTGRERRSGRKSCHSILRLSDGDPSGRTHSQKPSGTGRPTLMSATNLWSTKEKDRQEEGPRRGGWEAPRQAAFVCGRSALYCGLHKTLREKPEVVVNSSSCLDRSLHSRSPEKGAYPPTSCCYPYLPADNFAALRGNVRLPLPASLEETRKVKGSREI